MRGVHLRSGTEGAVLTDLDLEAALDDLADSPLHRQTARTSSFECGHVRDSFADCGRENRCFVARVEHEGADAVADASSELTLVVRELGARHPPVTGRSHV